MVYWLWWDGTPPSQVLAWIEQSRTLERLVEALPAALKLRGRHRARALASIDHAVLALPPTAWIDGQASRCCLSTEAWKRLQAQLRRWPALARVASLAQSGFVRERAVRASGAARDVGALPAVLPRVADWVVEVRAAALAAVEALLADERVDGQELLRVAAALLPWLQRRTRGARDADAAAAAVRRVLQDPRHRATLRAAWSASDAAVREMAVALSTGPGAALAMLEEGLLQDASMRVRHAVASRLASAADSLAPAHVEQVLRDRRASIVKAFLGGVRPSFVERHRGLVLQLAMDRRASVRSAAHAAWSGTAEALLPHVLEALDRRPTPGALLAIGELGGAAASVHVRPFVEHPDAALVAAAIVSLARLEGQPVDRLIAWLQAPEAAVRAAAARALARVDRWRWVEPVRELALGADGPVAVAARRLLLRGAVRAAWAALPDLLLCLGSEDASGRTARGALPMWLRRTSVRGWLRPDATTRAWLRRLGPVRRPPSSAAPRVDDAILTWLTSRVDALLREGSPG